MICNFTKNPRWTHHGLIREVALMFLKPYTGLSDDGLVEMLNGNIHMQMFCGVLIDPLKPVKKSATRRMQRRLLKLSGKLIVQWNNHCRQYASLISLTADQHKRITAIREVHRPQTDHFNKKDVRHRIVSIDRPYIRPIVRSKENKRVEFGAKVNNIQIDGISLIGHQSFEAFNEGTRLKQCVEYQE